MTSTLSTTPPPTSRLCSLPPELLHLISTFLPPPTLHNLSLVSRGFHAFIQPSPLSRSETYTLYKSQSDRSFGYHQVCKTCIRLRSFYHFPTTATGTNEDDCLDCLRRVRRFHTAVVRWLGMPIVKCRSCFRWVVEDVKAGEEHRCVEWVRCKEGEEEWRPVKAFIGWRSVDAVRGLFDVCEKMLPERWLFERLMMPGKTQVRYVVARRRLEGVVEEVARRRLERVKERWGKRVVGEEEESGVKMLPEMPLVSEVGTSN
ncbi:hypothetical protein EX30DRAFT_373797 [Ascodesmis nigricans]|uniref:F-box domain-containing protein n=1 Tax=Ascodesmis nigricans TaxID=341454 RepID=A0A4S2MRE6_9PEZI|nr:hypothetical protein EX30DRAFT_373797 [Ascodesmis nigricans]